MFWMSIVLVVAFSGRAYTLIDGCATTTFQHNGKCIPCPVNCTSCDSNTKCSICKSNYYGPACQKECEKQCVGICHKEYGHCTFGCKDGAYIMPESGLCMRCPTNCPLCSSAISCIACAKGFYGATCRSRCHDACLDNNCNNTNGACFGCKEGYFDTDDGCRRCPDGCARCNDTRKCSECQAGFYGPVDGSCIFECPKDDRNHRFLARSDDKCGISVGDTEVCPNVWGDQSYECLAERYCINYTACAADHRCTSGQDNDTIDGVCATVMTEGCRTVCTVPASQGQGSPWNHRCNQTCTVGVSNDTMQGSLCFHGNIPMAVNDSETDGSLYETIVLCSEDNPETGTPVTISGGDVLEILVIVESIVLTVLVVYVVATKCRRNIRRSRNRESRRELNQSDVLAGQENYDDIPMMTYHCQAGCSSDHCNGDHGTCDRADESVILNVSCDSRRENNAPEELTEQEDYDVIGMIPNQRQAGCSGYRYDHFNGPLHRAHGPCDRPDQSLKINLLTESRREQTTPEVLTEQDDYDLIGTVRAGCSSNSNDQAPHRGLNTFGHADQSGGTNTAHVAMTSRELLVLTRPTTSERKGNGYEYTDCFSAK